MLTASVQLSSEKSVGRRWRSATLTRPSPQQVSRGVLIKMFLGWVRRSPYRRWRRGKPIRTSDFPCSG